MSENAIPAPRYSIWQAIAAAISVSTRALEEVRAVASNVREPGPQGPEGPRGKLTGIRAWSKRIHYEGDPVTHKGSTWCALHDTAEEPPHADWLLIAAAGVSAPVGTVEGKFDPGRSYRKFDLVAHDGCEWRAKYDKPGPLPGEGWALSAVQGKRGSKGEPGDRGSPGPPGAAAPKIDDWAIDGFRVVPLMSDGTLGPALDLRQFFDRYHAEVQR